MEPASMDELADKGRVNRERREEHKKQSAEAGRQAGQRYRNLMTSPIGRLYLKANQAGYWLFVPIIVGVVVGVPLLEKYHMLSQFSHVLKSYPILKGYNIESVVILIIIAAPLILLGILYGLLFLIAVNTASGYYDREKKWLDNLPFIAEGYWELISAGRSSLEVTVVYKGKMPAEEKFKNVASGLGLDSRRSTDILADYFELEGDKLREAIDNTEKWKVTMDHVYIRSGEASDSVRSTSRRHREHGRVDYIRGRLREMITRFLVPLHQENPIAGIKING